MTSAAPCCFKAPVRREGQRIVTRFQLMDEMEDDLCSEVHPPCQQVHSCFLQPLHMLHALQPAAIQPRAAAVRCLLAGHAIGRAMHFATSWDVPGKPA